jgi:hypothetical protein
MGKYSYVHEPEEEDIFEPKDSVVLVEVGKEDNV